MTVIYVTGAAGTQMQTDLLVETVRMLGDQSKREGFADVTISFPTPTATSPERLSMVCMANVVVLVKGWEADRLARRDAQLAVWCEKLLRHDVGLRKAARKGGPEEVALVDYPYDKVQELLDRGLRVSMFEDTAAVDDVEGSG